MFAAAVERRDVVLFPDVLERPNPYQPELTRDVVRRDRGHGQQPMAGFREMV